MTRELSIPGRPPLRLEHLLLDVNGTLSDRGRLIPGVRARIARLRRELQVHLVSADTFGTLAAIADELQARALRVATGEEKLAELALLGPEHCAVVGNGTNDAAALAAAALGIAVIGPEGASGAALAAADIICASILDALELLLDDTVLAATLRA